MNIALVGGGGRTVLLLHFLEKHSLRAKSSKVVAVADENDNAPGLVMARERGIFATNDYNDFLDRDDIDLIIELTGKKSVYYDILSKKKTTVRAVDFRTAMFFWEFTMDPVLREKEQEELQEVRAFYNLMLNELIQEDFMLIDSNYRILEINENLLRKLGLERREAVGRHCYEITHRRSAPCSGEEYPCPLRRTLETKKPFEVTHVHFDKDNKTLFHSIYCYPLMRGGKVTGVIEMSRDITKDINIQKVLMQQDKMASIGRLAAGVAHEINNPLTTVLTSTMLIQEDTDPGDPKYQELQTIADEALRCRRIVSSLLDFARQTKPTKKLTSLHSVITECLVLTRKQAAFKDVTMEQRFAEDLPLVSVDKDQITQALMNLILNAIEATAPGEKVTLATAFIPESDVIELTVIDSGRGISQENIQRVFDPFFTTKESGTGLGLAITHGIIEQHGGIIKVKSKPVQGTSFTIRLPMSRGDNNAQ